MKHIVLFLLLVAFARAADRPNVVFILSEDNSIHYLDHWFKGGAKAPNIEALAANGLTFDHAFSNAPVCSTARTTLATSCYGPRIGTQFHRKYKQAAQPGRRMFTAYLRDAGYYTSNNAKTDYNAVATKDTWHESSGRANWRNRPEGSPFFHMESHGASHEGSLHFKRASYENDKTTHDPAKVELAPYFPDTPLFRYTHARYLDRMLAIDQIVGNTLNKLKEDGLLEDTFVFYFGDHGGVLPRGKGYIYESGLHVPLAVRIPENFKHLADGKRGDRVNGFVSFIDFGATALQLAGVDIPEHMDGKPFLGKGITMAEVNARDEAFGYADRFDEKYEFIRSIRKGKYQYIRHYQPWLPDGLNNNYRYKMLAFAEWRALWNAGKLGAPQDAFFKAKPVEMLFDCAADPHQVKDLSGDPAQAATLASLRARLTAQVKALPDLSFYPESKLVREAMDDPVAYGQKNKEQLNALVDTANLALLPFAEAKPGIEQALNSGDPMQRYWGAMVCSAFGDEAKALAGAAKPLLEDPEEIVRVRAAEFLGLLRTINPQTVLTQVVNSTHDPVVATEALNSVVLFKDLVKPPYPVERADFNPKANGADVMDRLNYINGVPYPPKKPRKPKKNRKNTGKAL